MYRTTEHKKAIVKMVKQKRLILQVDLATVMNKKDINQSVKSLVEEGKIKREKIKVRGNVGNLTEMWLVYSNDVKQQEILEFEIATVNRPFTSPLVENHCYKSPENPVEQKIKTGNAILDYFNGGRKEKVEVAETVALTLVTNEVIPIYNNNNQRMVNARELHEFLGVGKDFSSWIKDRINKYQFSENLDYMVFTKSGENLKGGRPSKEYYLTIDTAKEISMVENNEKGRYIRKYFIQIENEHRQQNNLQPTSGINALKLIVEELENHDNRITNLEGTMDSLKKAIAQ